MRLLLERNHYSILVSEQLGSTSNQAHRKQPHQDWFEIPSTRETDVDSGTATQELQGDESASFTNKISSSLYKSRRVRSRKNVTGQVKAMDKQKIKKSSAVMSVTNLSRHKLTEAQLSLLERGLKFIPSKHRVDKVKLLADLSEWERRMRLAEFFHGEDGENMPRKEDDKFRVKKKSTFTPPSGRDKSLDLYIELVKEDVIANLKRSSKLNVTREENSAFYELLHDKDIVIRPADKGSGIVVVDKDSYVQSLQKEMDDSDSYEATGNDQTEEIQKKVKRLVGRMHREGAISDDLKQYLTPRYSQKGKLKGNPKLHKPNAPYRTIVSGIGTPTERLAEVAEHELNEFVETSPSYIRDTTDFICKLQEIKEPLPENAFLFCFDVAKLYPSVPRKEGLDACKEALESRSTALVDTASAMEMIRTVLDNNIFGFGDQNYIQREGVAIGSRLGKNFACSYMRKWDEALLEAPVTPLFYKRFIDDGFGVWTGSETELEEFAAYANSIHDNIKVELRYDRKQIEFLDTLVKIEDGHIYTDLFIKPSDKQLYLNSSSCHPPNTKKGLAYGLGLRIKRICEKEADYQRHRTSLKVQLRRRGYSGNLIETQLQKVDKLERSELLQRSAKNDKNAKRVPLVVTYSNLLPDVRGIIRKHMDVLYRSTKMKDVFQEPPIVAYRRDKNICDTLVHGKTNAALKSVRNACKTGCANCELLSRDVVRDTSNSLSFQPARDITCRVRNVVYAIICTRCQATVYVGETERELRERMSEHLRDIRLKKDKPINFHFGGKGHTNNDVAFAVLEKTFDAERTERQLREGLWIKKLASGRPNGCNVKDSFVSAVL